jgi:phosphoribosyl-AMP cyclohydrolase
LFPAVVRLQQSSHEPAGGLQGVAIVTDTVLTPEEREAGSVFAPKFDTAGLITAVVVDATNSAVLVVAHMNSEALTATLDTGKVHFWSRSRGKLWLKGETSGHFLMLDSIAVDCDQDALLIRATPAGPTCHTGMQSCFYRQIEVRDGGIALRRIDA